MRNFLSQKKCCIRDSLSWMLLAETLEIDGSGPWEFDVNYGGEEFKLALGDGGKHIIF